MRKVRLRKPSPALFISCLALFIALSGTSYAVVVLPKNSVGTKQLKKDAVKSAKIADNQVTGADVNEATLGQVPSAATANSANTAASARNADSLDGIDSAAFLLSGGKAADSEKLDDLDSTAFLRSTGKAADSEKLDNLDSTAFLRTSGTAFNSERLGGKPASAFQESCRDGAVKAFVKVLGSATFPSSFTSDPAYVRQAFNCTGGLSGVLVRVQRTGVGAYTVDFRNGFPTTVLAIGSVLSDSAGGSGGDDFVTVQHWWNDATFTEPSTRLWNVSVRDADGGNEDAWFYLAVL